MKMMKSVTLVLSLAASATATGGGLRDMLGMGSSFDATSAAAKHLLAKANNGERRLEDEVNIDVLVDYSVVFQGCHNSTSWSEDGVQYMGLVQFKLCHTYYCGDDGKCRSQMAGDYVVDLATFVDSYLEAKLEQNRYKCEQMRETCGCDGDNDDCMYYCYKTYRDDDLKWSDCQEGQGDEERLGECQGLEINNDDDGDDGGRRLDNNGGYFTGPYCGPDGESVHMSIFKDEECSMHVNDPADLYYMLSGGKNLKYSYASGNSLVKKDCIDCMEPQEQNDDDAEDENEITRMCEETYQRAAKCETYMTDMGYYRDTSGCSLIAQLNTMSALNMQMSFNSSSGWTVGSFMVLLACVFVAMGTTLYYAKKAKKQTRRNAPSLMEAEMTPQVPS